MFSMDYNRFLGVLMKNRRFELAEYYYNTIIPKGFSLNSFTYSRFISGLCEDMDRLGIVPDIWACNIYLNLLCSEYLVNDALKFLILMGEKGRSLIALVLGLCGSGKVDLAYEHTAGYMRGKVKFNRVIYNVLIDGFCLAGRIDKALAIKTFMRRNGCEPDLTTHNVLLNYCCNELMLDEAEKLMEKMGRSGMKPDSYSYNELLKGPCKANRVDKAYMLLGNKMEAKGFVGVVSYNIIINALCKAGHTSRAYECFSGRRQHECKTGRVEMAYSVFMIWLVKLVSHASLYEEKQTRCVYPDEVTFKLITGGLLKENKLSLACGVWDQMKGFTLDRDLLENLINAINSKEVS
ncbi:hypothetical protein Pfo_009321 [Paulownia fortunei]|nr:hypothetical protein Pfo_009321 [Paulownia fortunei]